MQWPLAMDCFHYVRRVLDSIKKLTELAQIKSTEQEGGSHFYDPILREMGEADLLLENFSQYLSTHIPLRKKDTLHKLIDELFRKYQNPLEVKGIHLSKEFEEDLPEAILPEEPLKFILESLLQYGIKKVSPNGKIECSTRSFLFQGEGREGQRFPIRSKRYIEIRLVFENTKKRDRPFEEIQTGSQKDPIDLVLRLVEEIVQKNGGRMEVETVETSGNEWISIQFPSERRKRVALSSIDPCFN